MTPLFIHNTLSGKKEKFHPKVLKKPRVTMYSCGPTVYDTAHIGNFRTFVMNDIIRRVFEYKGYAVDHAMNITDVDDKTIRRSREESVSLEKITEKYERLFWQDMASLNILKPQHILGARAHVADMIALIEKLLEKGVAYAADDGIYMSVTKVKHYGELAHIRLEKSDGAKTAGNDTSHERIANDEYDKENPRDFALWKFSNERGGVDAVGWDAPFGRGRPGWHIECSAMAMSVFGPTVDIHTGGVDLIFPHHTNEIAQSESATGETFVRYWIHGGFMNVNDEKMAKSKGNFMKLSDLSVEHISPIAFRYWLLTSHYRSQVNFSFEAVRAAQTALFKLCHDVIEWAENDSGERPAPDNSTVLKYLEDFDLYISDDFNMPKAVALMWKAVKDTALSPAEKRQLVLKFDEVFGLRLGELETTSEKAVRNENGKDLGHTKNSDNSKVPKIPPEIAVLAEAREVARLDHDFQKADALRLEIESRGYRIVDEKTGFSIEKIFGGRVDGRE